MPLPAATEWTEALARYLDHSALTKRPRTVELEKLHLSHFGRHANEPNLDQITRQVVVNYRTARLAAGWTPRTCNLAVTILRMLLKHALDTGSLGSMPFDHLESLKHVSKRKRLYDWPQIEALCNKAIEQRRNGQQFSDYVKLMCLCGARRDETLRLKWQDVDWTRRQLIIGSDGLSKNHHSRSVDISPSLEAHLREMHERRDTTVDWLFVSARTSDQRVRTFKQTLWAVRDEAGMSDFAFHHCRVFFASACVMANIDFRTVSSWLGHRDGGVLLSKVYARLSDEHKRRAAAKLEIG